MSDDPGRGQPQSTPAPPVSPTAPAAWPPPQPPGVAPWPGGPPPSGGRTSKHAAVAAILAVAAIALVVGLVVVVSGNDGGGGPAASGGSGAPTTAAPSTTTPTTLGERTVDVAPPTEGGLEIVERNATFIGDPQVDSAGTQYGRQVFVGAIVENTTDAAALAAYVFDYVDSSGNVVHTSSPYTYLLVPGPNGLGYDEDVATEAQTHGFDPNAVADVVVRRETDPYGLDSGGAPGLEDGIRWFSGDGYAPFEVSDVVFGSADYENVAFGATVTSPYEDSLSLLDAVVILRDQEGEIVGGFGDTPWAGRPNPGCNYDTRDVTLQPHTPTDVCFNYSSLYDDDVEALGIDLTQTEVYLYLATN